MKLSTPAAPTAEPLILVDGTYRLGGQHLFEITGTTYGGSPVKAYIQDRTESSAREQAEDVGITISEVGRVCKELADDFFDQLSDMDYVDFSQYCINSEYEPAVDVMQFQEAA